MAPKPQYVKQNKFYRGIIGTDEFNDMDFSTQQPKSRSSFAVAYNIITQANKNNGNYFHKRSPTDFVSSVESEDISLIPFVVSVEPNDNKAQVIAFTSAKDQSKVINYNTDVVNVVNFPSGNVMFEDEDIKTLDYVESGGMLFFSQKNIPMQVMYYDFDNPSITEFQFKSDSTAGSSNASNNYYKFFRSLTGNSYLLDPNLSINIYQSKQLKLLNNKNYRFKVNDILRLTYTLDVTKVQANVNDISVYPYIMDCIITEVDPQGVTATKFTVINNSSDLPALMASGAIPFSQILADTIGLNYENAYFEEYASNVYPSGVTIINQRLLFILGNTVFFSAIGDYFNFYQSSKIFSDQPYSMTFQQNESSSGMKMSTLNNQVFFPTTRTATFCDYSDGKLIPHNAEVSVANIKPMQFENVILAVHGSQRSIMPLYYIRNTDRVQGQSMDNWLFNPRSDIFTGDVVQLAVQQNPEQRLWSLLGSGEVVLSNLGVGDNGTVSAQGVTKIKHGSGPIVSVCSLNLAPQSAVFMGVKQIINDRSIISIEKTADNTDIFDNKDSVYLDRRTKYSTLKSGITYTGNGFVLNIYGVNNNHFDTTMVKVVIRQKDSEDQITELEVNNGGNISIPKKHFDHLNDTDQIQIFTGVDIICDFQPIISIPYNPQQDCTLMPNNVEDMYITLHTSSSSKASFGTLNDDLSIENPAQHKDNEEADRLYFDMVFSQDRNIYHKPKFSTIRNQDPYFFAIQEIGYLITWG